MIPFFWGKYEKCIFAKGFYDKGINRLQLTDREIQGSGLFFVSISSNGKTVTKRVFKN